MAGFLKRLMRAGAVALAALACGPHPAQAGAGQLLRSQPLFDAPDGAAAYKIFYQSTGLHGEPITVSGMVIAPPGPAPEGGRPVVAWAHPTTGVVPRCAPSLARKRFQMIAGLHLMLARGYVVAATDYPGLGTPEPHPYLVGDSEGRAVLDSVRAARQIAAAGAGARFVVWGHSQGGQAALFTGLSAPAYAPDLQLLGVAAAAPATELSTLMNADLDTSGGRNLTAMTLWSWARVYHAPSDSGDRSVGDPRRRPLGRRMHRIDLRHFRAPLHREAARPRLSQQRPFRRRRTVVVAVAREHAGRAAVEHSAVRRPGRNRRARSAARDARVCPPGLRQRQRRRSSIPCPTPATASSPSRRRTRRWRGSPTASPAAAPRRPAAAEEHRHGEPRETLCVSLGEAIQPCARPVNGLNGPVAAPVAPATAPLRRARACPGHPRRRCESKLISDGSKFQPVSSAACAGSTWMAGTSPAMTAQRRERPAIRRRLRRLPYLPSALP